jgi:hypothetical protein
VRILSLSTTNENCYGTAAGIFDHLLLQKILEKATHMTAYYDRVFVDRTAADCRKSFTCAPNHKIKNSAFAVDQFKIV